MNESFSKSNVGLRRWRYLIGEVFRWACLVGTMMCVIILAVLLVVICYHGRHYFNWHFLTSLPSRFPHKAGVYVALMGSLWVIGLTAALSVPVGIASAIYLEEYAGRGWWVRLVRMNISNLAGVPSIVYGILGLGLFVRTMSMDRSVLAGGLTLSLLILPIIIIASREALRAVPDSLRHASYALGATRWQTVWRQVLPVALPGMMTGVILALSRALGEAAPLVIVGAVAYVATAPSGLYDTYTALPLQIFNWSGRPQSEFHDLAASGIIVLLGILFFMNAIAVTIRHRFSRIQSN